MQSRLMLALVAIIATAAIAASPDDPLKMTGGAGRAS
jgi:hypothetical protein